MTDEQYIDIAIEISKKARYHYGAKYSKNKIEIVKELHRDKAVEVLKMRGE